MHGSENYHRFVNGLGVVEDVTIGQNVSLILEVCLLYLLFHLLIVISYLCSIRL